MTLNGRNPLKTASGIMVFYPIVWNLTQSIPSDKFMGTSENSKFKARFRNLVMTGANHI